MRFLALLFLTAILAGWIIFGRYWYVCKIKKHCGGTTTELVSHGTRPMTLSVRDGERIILENYEQFSFPDKSVNADMTANNTEFLDQLAAYVKANKDKKLKITGFFRESEIGMKSGFFDNLGIARAAAIKKALEARGVDGMRIAIDYNKVEGNDLLEPVTFSLSSTQPSAYDEGEERLSDMQFDFHNMTFTEANFDFDSDVFKPGSAFVAYADSVKTYLGLNKEKTLTIIGHADSQGTKTYNHDLGLRRSTSVREYFRQMGIEGNINIGSKGEDEPVAPNNTPANRQKNRRVNVLIE